MDPGPVSQDALTVRRLRRGVGVVGVALPFVVTVGNALLAGRFTLLTSISGSYHTGMRDVFVGSLCAMGVFLICYRYRRLDDLWSSLAGTLAIVVALCPTTAGADPSTVDHTDVLVGRVHQVCAAALFVILAGFCLLLFPRTEPGDDLGPRKGVRNRVYRVCGWLIVAAIVATASSSLLPVGVRETVRPVFWGEMVAVLAFGMAWLVKGAAIIADDTPLPQPSTTARPRPRQPL
ncbi:DUF998 domain-containing protein [Micromonospora sp. NPDC000089]|uniref:DUF998 domain-containing protein n=1 Tax=Micromonospora sp. NPDC000089 TaxID=3364213 RepID=UPI00368A3587